MNFGLKNWIKKTREDARIKSLRRFLLRTFLGAHSTLNIGIFWHPSLLQKNFMVSEPKMNISNLQKGNLWVGRGRNPKNFAPDFEYNALCLSFQNNIQKILQPI